jgi:hypothetical protein
LDCRAGHLLLDRVENRRHGSSKVCRRFITQGVYSAAAEYTLLLV